VRIGELLLQRGYVDWDTLARALKDHRRYKVRLCSYLLARGILAFDQASRALGEQRGTAAVLLRHLQRRDRELAELLPDDLARALVAIPIGRLGDGRLIVCVRDPLPEVSATLTRVLGEEPVLAVTPARALEKLVEQVYAPRELDADELEEIDDEQNVDDALEEVEELDAALEPGPLPPEASLDIPIDFDEGLASDDPGADPGDSFELAIEVELSGDEAKRPASRALPVEIKPRLPTSPLAIERDPLDAALAAFRDIDELPWLLDVAMAYVASQWTASVLLELRDRRAVAIRGHGDHVKPMVVKTLVLDIDDTTIVARARSEQRIIDEAPDDLGADHAELAAVLAARGCPLAAPIVRGDVVSHVLVLADPVSAEREDALVDLGLLVESMGEALARM
jgi:hypothetical protein